MSSPDLHTGTTQTPRWCLLSVRHQPQHPDPWIVRECPPRPDSGHCFRRLHVHIAGGGQRGMAQDVLHPMHRDVTPVPRTAAWTAHATVRPPRVARNGTDPECGEMSPESYPQRSPCLQFYSSSRTTVSDTIPPPAQGSTSTVAALRHLEYVDGR